MKRAVVAITRRGAALAEEIRQKLDCDVYILKKYCKEQDFIPFDTGMQQLMGQLFSTYREIVLIMACGIAVRSIAPWLRSKLTDPAIVVADESGRFAISLVSGHIGGANRLASELAGITRGCAVITTASDIRGIEAIDMLAQKLGLMIEDYEAAKIITAILVNGGRAGLLCEEGIEAPGVSGIPPYDGKNPPEEALDGLVYIGYRNKIRGIPGEIPAARLITRNLAVGVGCRKGTDSGKLMAFAAEIFEANDLSLKAVKTVATADIKENETAILELGRSLDADVEIIARDRIAEIEDEFSGSDFVKRITGVGCICEPAAFMASKGGLKLIPKTAKDGMTLSVYAEKVILEGKYEG